MNRFNSISFLVICTGFGLCVLSVMIVLLVVFNPAMFGMIDRLFAETDAEVDVIRISIESAMARGEAVELKSLMPIANNFCVLPREVDPTEIVTRESGTRTKLRFPRGGLMGWNDNNWHVVFFYAGGAAVASMGPPGIYFSDDAICGARMVLRPDRAIQRVHVDLSGT